MPSRVASKVGNGKSYHHFTLWGYFSKRCKVSPMVFPGKYQALPTPSHHLSHRVVNLETHSRKNQGGYQPLRLRTLCRYIDTPMTRFHITCNGPFNFFQKSKKFKNEKIIWESSYVKDEIFIYGLSWVKRENTSWR